MVDSWVSDSGQSRHEQVAPIYPPRPWHRKSRTWIAVTAVVALLTAAVLVWGPWRTVRVTDGGEVLAENLAFVQKLIHDENNRVTDSGRPWVSIALMLPIHPATGKSNTPAWVLHHIQGAYLAQYWSNHPHSDEFGDELPLIRLLLADIGPEGQDWHDTVAQLVNLADPEDGEHLVAVTGLGQSTLETQAAVDELSRHHIPMVGSIITATTLAADGLVRVSPSNSDEAAAAIAFLRTTETWQIASPTAPYTAYLVQDKDKANIYSKDLGREYREQFPNDSAHNLSPVEGNFDSSQPGVDTALEHLRTEICAIRPRVVLFTGRSSALRTFVEKLAGRYCTDTSITIVSGDSARNLATPVMANENPLWVDDDANLDVLFTALASPRTWTNYPSSVSARTVFRFQHCTHCFEKLFSEQLDDGNAIVSYDAVLTAVTAARKVASEQNPQPTAGALINGLYQITASDPVPGASGWIYFQRDTDVSDVVPYNKAVPIMQLHPDGTATELALSSRLGRPPSRPEPPR